ncbi:MAG: Flp family type IVb pilin [Pseudomonadota bacterium]
MALARAIRTFLRKTHGATAIEYGLIASLITIAVIIGATQTGQETKKPFETIGTEIKKANEKV